MTNRRTWLWVAVMLSVVGLGCGASMRSATAEQINCAPADTIIENSHSELDRELWIASCRGRRTEYACSQGKSGDDQVHCAKTSGGDATSAMP